MARAGRAVGSLFLPALLAVPAAWASDPVLNLNGDTLTSYIPTAKGLVQQNRPSFELRGVDIDGTLRSPAPAGWSIHADPFGGGYGSGRRIGDINLATGGYAPTEIDFALPARGPGVVIGRMYNAQQIDSGSRYDSDGYQGYNWSQAAQPEIVYKAGGTSADDTIYLVYGADRYIEFKSTGSGAKEFRACNGAAGVIDKTDASGSDPDIYTYFDQRGNAVAFFGFDSNAGNAKGQWWRTTDPSGAVAYVEHATAPATAVSGGYDGSGRILTIYDASNRRYSFTYSAVPTLTRLTEIKVEIQSGGGGSWTSPTLVAQVDYAYYDGTIDTTSGLAGDLRLVTVTTKGTSTDLVRKKYYRYYTSSWSNSDGSRGNPHQIKMVVGFEGVRSTGAGNLASTSDNGLKSSSEAWMEYVSGSDYRLAKGFFNGECGCSGGTNGAYEFTYGQSGSYSTYTGNTSYDTGWATRTVVKQPDANYVTVYFDEVGQVLARVMTNADPAGSPGKRWVNEVARDSAGLVTELYSPETNSSYTHSSGSLGHTSSGLVTVYGRLSASSDLDGLRTSVGVKNGSGGSATTVSAVTYDSRQMAFDTCNLTVPVLATSAVYPAGSALTTTYTPTWWENSTASDPNYICVKSMQVDAPTVTTGNNGSGSATTTSSHLRPDGTTVFTVDALGRIGYSGRNQWGLAVTQIADANTSTSGDFQAEDTPSTWGVATSGSAVHAKTTMTYDDQGRIATVASPGVNATRTAVIKYAVESDGQLSTYSFPRSSGSTWYGPCAYSRANHAGRTTRQGMISISGSGTTTVPSSTPSSGTWANLVDTTYDSPGAKVLSTSQYPTIGGTADTTTYGYDTMGRKWRVQDPTGTVRRTVFDERGLATESWIGTGDSGFTGGSGTDDMTKVEVMEYDAASSTGGKNGHLTKRTQDADGNWATTGDQRETSYAYDYRGRVLLVTNPVAPHILTKYDELNRAVAVGQYSTAPSASSDPTASSSSNRVGLSETAYDQRGQVYQTTAWEIIQSTGAKGDSLVTNTWYDAAGRALKSAGAQVSKTVYDRLGRVTDRYTIAKNASTSYSDASSVSGDKVIEESHSTLHATTGRPTVQYTVQRAHDYTTAGALASSVTSFNGRISISAMWYDDWDRVTDTAAYGHVTGFSYGGSAPTRSNTELVTTYAYDGFGRVQTLTDPASVAQRTAYDDMGRRTSVIDNYVDGTPGGGTNGDEDRVTEYTYSAGLTATVTRKMPGSGNDQTTTYEYLVTKSASQVASKALLSAVIYPEQSSGQSAAFRTVTYTYNALSQVRTTQDPGGNVITTTYDNGGRVTLRHATTIGSGFDGTVAKVATSYDGRGKVTSVQQKDSSDAVLDEVQFAYDDWGNVTTMTQDPDSAVGGGGRASGSLSLYWARNTVSGGWQSMMLTGTTQPGGVDVNPVYGGSTTLSGLLGRPMGLDDGASLTYAQYEYLGLGTVVGVTLGEPSIYSRAYGTGGSSDYTTYMDEFGRPKLGKWVKDNTSGTDPAFVDFEPTWNRYGQAVTVKDNVLYDASATPKRSFDQASGFDALRRMIDRTEGELTSGSISTQSRLEKFARNLAGKATNDTLSLNSDSDGIDGPPNSQSWGEMNDDRTYNQRNELTKREYLDSSYPSTRHTVNLTYDKNGNLTDDGEKFEYQYNTWCQLVLVKLRGTNTVVARYTYNGLGHRISEQTDTNDSSNTGIADGVVDSYDPVFYIFTDLQGRRLATYRGNDTYPKETFIHHAAGLGGPHWKGGPLLRDRDDNLTNPAKWANTAASSVRLERRYYASDFRGNVTALLSDVGELAEQYRYSATGVPFGIPLGDVTSDGLVQGTSGGADYDELTKHIGGTYAVRCDLDLDGDVDTTDRGLLASQNGNTTGRGTLSAAGVGVVFAARFRTWNSAIETMCFGEWDLRVATATRLQSQVISRQADQPLAPWLPDASNCYRVSRSRSECYRCCTYDDPDSGGEMSDLACVTNCDMMYDVLVEPQGDIDPDPADCTEFFRVGLLGFTDLLIETMRGGGKAACEAACNDATSQASACCSRRGRHRAESCLQSVSSKSAGCHRRCKGMGDPFVPSDLQPSTSPGRWPAEPPPGISRRERDQWDRDRTHVSRRDAGRGLWDLIRNPGRSSGDRPIGETLGLPTTTSYLPPYRLYLGEGWEFRCGEYEIDLPGDTRDLLRPQEYKWRVGCRIVYPASK